MVNTHLCSRSAYKCGGVEVEYMRIIKLRIYEIKSCNIFKI